MLPEVTIRKDPAQKVVKVEPTTFPTYNGDRSTYPAWRRAVLSALKMDWNTFGYTDSRVFLMIYKALEGKAQKRAGAYFESGGRGGEEKPEDFIAFLDRGNWDQTRATRAKSELNDMKMGLKQSWSSFYPQWANKLTEATGDMWPDDVKVSLLRATLNQTLRIALANNHLVPEDDFSEFVRIVSKIAQQHEEIAKAPRERQAAYFNNSKPAQVKPENNSSYDHAKQNFVGGLDGAGDTVMGGVNMANVLRGPSGKPLRAKWKTPEEIEKLRRERRCFRCERKGCSTKTCRILPAKRPPKFSPIVNSASLEPINLSVCEEDDVDEGSVSESVSEN